MSHERGRQGPLVSVVMPTFNRADLIEQSVATVQAQTYRHWELLVADDGSTDETASRIEGLRDDRIRFLSGPHVGLAAAVRNRALKAACGELIAFLDSDDLWRPFKLERQVRWLADHPDVGLLYTQTEVFDADGVQGVRPEGPASPQGDVFWPLSLGNFVPINTVIVRAEVLRAAGLQDERAGIAEDFEHWLRLARTCHFGYLPEVTAAYRLHGGNLSADRLREAVRARDALLPLLQTAPGPGWRRVLARTVSQARIAAVAAADPRVDDAAFLALWSPQPSSLMARSLGLAGRPLLRGLLKHRAALERLTRAALRLGSSPGR